MTLSNMFIQHVRFCQHEADGSRWMKQQKPYYFPVKACVAQRPKQSCTCCDCTSWSYSLDFNWMNQLLVARHFLHAKLLSSFQLADNEDVVVRGITTLYHDPVTEIFILQKHVFSVWTS